MSRQSVFVSYSHRDAALARSVEKVLKSVGIDSFTAREVAPGEDWRKSIQAAIKRSDALVLIASPDALSSSWASYETGVAEALGKHVMVLLSNRHSVTELPEEIALGQVVNFDPQAPERAARDIVARLAAA
jgi:nucleoside 2-deoxyribosyltransferase